MGFSDIRTGCSLIPFMLFLCPISPAGAQETPAPQPAPQPTAPAAVPAAKILSIAIAGNQRLEAQTILSYLRLRVGQSYDLSLIHISEPTRPY